MLERIKKLLFKDLSNTAVAIAAMILLTATGIFIDATMAWYQSGAYIVADSWMDGSADAGNIIFGYDAFKYNHDTTHGEQLPNRGIITLNNYDKFLKGRNRYNPIILRAAISNDVVETALDKGEPVVLNMDCSEFANSFIKSQQRLSLTDEPGTAADKPGEGQHYLSNIVNVKVAMYPGLADESIDSSIVAASGYYDAADYVWNKAVDFFMNPEHYQGLARDQKNYDKDINGVFTQGVARFVNIGGQAVEETDTEGASVTLANTNSFKANERYLIRNTSTGPGVYLTHSLGASAFIYNEGTYSDNNDNPTEATDIIRDLNSCYWIADSTGRTTKLYFNGANGGKQYLTLGLYGLETTTNNSAALTLTYENGQLTFYNAVGHINYLNGWYGTLASGGVTLQQETVETTTYTSSQWVSTDEWAKATRIQIRIYGCDSSYRDPVTGYYFVYVMVDYDDYLVDEYMKKNGSSVKLGDDNIDFPDSLTLSLGAY